MRDRILIGALAVIGCVCLANLLINVYVRPSVQKVETAIQSIPPATHYSRGIGGGNAGLCQTAGKGCAAVLVAAMNADRAAVGAPPLKLSWPQTHGNSLCPGSTAHAKAMVADSTIWHVSPSHPAESFQPPTYNICIPSWSTIGENVGVGLGTKLQAIMQTYQLMMAETPPADGHRMNILSQSYSQVGIGFAQGTYAGYPAWFVVEDFVG